jgi:inorganic pyrophosphatase
VTEPDIGDRVLVRVEVPRGSFLKRRSDGSVDFLSPFPSPFNYGSVPGTLAPDGEPLDAILLGPRRRAGHSEQLPVVAFVRFVDAGVVDTKLVCSAMDLRDEDRRALRSFFRLYAVFKSGLNRLRGRPGRTAYDGLVEGGTG